MYMYKSVWCIDYTMNNTRPSRPGPLHSVIHYNRSSCWYVYTPHTWLYSLRLSACTDCFIFLFQVALAIVRLLTFPSLTGSNMASQASTIADKHRETLYGVILTAVHNKHVGAITRALEVIREQNLEKKHPKRSQAGKQVLDFLPPDPDRVRQCC